MAAEQKPTLAKATVKKVAQKPVVKVAKSEGSNGKPAKVQTKEGQGRASSIVNELQGKKVKILVDENPKRGKSAERFAVYKNGLTVEKLLENGLTTADLRYDINKGFVKFE